MLPKDETMYKVELLNGNSGYFFKTNQLIFQTKTKYQNLEIYNTEDYGKILCLDNTFQTSDFDEFLYHEPLIHIPHIALKNPKSVLIIGGGDGGAIKQVLKYKSIENITVVELDEDVVKYSIQYLPQISDGAFNSNKVNLIIGDGKKYIESTNQKFDCIILDLTDPFGPSASLYTSEFFTKIKQNLNHNGILSLHIQSPITRPLILQRIYSTLKSVFTHVNTIFNYIPLYGTLWGFGIASNTINIDTITSNDIKNILNQHNINDLKFYNEKTHFALTAIPNYIQNILNQSQEIITELNKDQLINLADYQLAIQKI